jgi:uncharacterized membrane protein YgcG
MRKIILSTLLALGVAGGGWAGWSHFASPAAMPPRPVAPFTLTGRVVDNAQLIPAVAEARLVDKLAGLELNNGPQFVVVTVPSLAGQTIEQLGMVLGNGWAVGNAERNDGVLLIVAPTERKVRIEVGKGLEATLTNRLCDQVIQNDILPRFRAGNMQQGIEVGAERIMALLSARPIRQGNAG